MRRALALVCFAAAGVLLLVIGLPDRAAYIGTLTELGISAAPEVGRLAPPFNADTVSGEPLALTLPPGTVIILNFWATWCEPCRLEMPELQQISVAYPDVRVIGVNLGERREQASAWADALGLTFPLALDPDGAIARRYALRAQPTTFVIAPDGLITAIFLGATDAERLRPAVDTARSIG